MVIMTQADDTDDLADATAVSASADKRAQIQGISTPS